MRWSDDLVEEKILYATELLKIDRFPTQKELINAYGDTALTNQIYRRGGVQYWADRLKLPRKDRTRFLEYEMLAMEHINEKTGLKCERMKEGYTYDVLANKYIKIDVKKGRLFTNQNGTVFNTFRIRKQCPTCDFYICYCVDNNDKIIKILVIPAAAVAGKKQISVALNKSKWDIYGGQWNQLKEFAEFSDSMIKELETPKRKPKTSCEEKEVS